MTVEVKHGARVQLERAEASGATARYRVRVWEATPLEQELYFEASAELSASGVALSPWRAASSGPPPVWADGAPAPWVITFTDQLLRTLVKNHAAAGDWPRKLTRWRQER